MLRELCSHHQGIPVPCTSHAFRGWDKFQSVCGSHALCSCCSRAPLLVSSVSIITQRSTCSGWCCTQTQRDNPCLPLLKLGRGRKERPWGFFPSFYEQKVGCSPLHMNCKVIKNLSDFLDTEGKYFEKLRGLVGCNQLN